MPIFYKAISLYFHILFKRGKFAFQFTGGIISTEPSSTVTSKCNTMIKARAETDKQGEEEAEVRGAEC